MDKQMQKKFNNWKTPFISIIILFYYNSNLEMKMEKDVSNLVVAETLSQMHNRVFESVVFFKAMLPAEYNYTIKNKKLLVIIKVFKTWKSKVISLNPNNPIQIYIGHKTLEHFIITKQFKYCGDKQNFF